MNVVKVSSGSSRLSQLLLRQTPCSKGIWGDCKFVVNQQVPKCDAWFVLHHSGLIHGEQTECDPTKVFYVSMEPYESIGNVSSLFLDQFSCLIGCDPELASRLSVRKNIHTWWAGINVRHHKTSHRFSPSVKLAYDDFCSSSSRESNKLDRICCIVSTKVFLEGHRDRLCLANRLATSPAGKYIDFYGGLGESFLDKFDVQSRYKYSLVLENSILAHYWSEKVADTFLASSFPFYLGCPNIDQYFHQDSITLLNGKPLALVSDLLCSAIEKDLYAKRISALEASRLAVLNQYNVFNEMARLVASPASAKNRIRLRPNAYFTETRFQRVRRRFSLAKRFVQGAL